MKSLLLILFSISVLSLSSQSIFYFDPYNTGDQQIEHVFDTVPLQNGIDYCLIVEGSYSIWRPSFWTAPCGTIENTPIFPSPVGFMTGNVGFDMEYAYSFPEPNRCNGSSLPQPTQRMEISVDGGVTWFHPPTNDPFNASHIYHYKVTGKGFPVGIRQLSPLNSDDYGLLKFTFTTDTSCVVAATVEPTCDEAGALLEMPNIFTPNHDGKNDIFRPIVLDCVDQANLHVFNRWGRELHQSNGTTISWDGKTPNGSNASDGVYFWIVRYRDLYGRESEKSGVLHLFGH